MATDPLAPGRPEQLLFTLGKGARFANIEDVATRKLARWMRRRCLGHEGSDLKFYDDAWPTSSGAIFKWGEAAAYDVRVDDPH